MQGRWAVFFFFLIVWGDLNLGEDTLHAAGSRLLAGGRGLLLTASCVACEIGHCAEDPTSPSVTR